MSGVLGLKEVEQLSLTSLRLIFLSVSGGSDISRLVALVLWIEPWGVSHARQTHSH